MTNEDSFDSFPGLLLHFQKVLKSEFKLT